jgi:hypothetical protein
LVTPRKPSIKIEGAMPRGYRSITVAGVCDPAVIANLDAIQQQVHGAVADNLSSVIQPDEWTLRFLRFGLDAVTEGRCVPAGSLPREVGIVIEAIAPTQECADTVLSLARSTTLHQHFEGRKTTAGNLAFPFSPSDFRGGEVYEFAIYHLMETSQTGSLFPIHYMEL